MVEEVAAWRAEWMASLSEEQKGALQADRASYANEETKAERMTELAQTFNACDTNQDQLLDRVEMESFMKCLRQNSEARGVPSMDTDSVSDEMKDKVWALYNGATEGTDGVSMADFAKVTQEIGAAIKAAMGQ